MSLNKPKYHAFFYQNSSNSCNSNDGSGKFADWNIQTDDKLNCQSLYLYCINDKKCDLANSRFRYFLI